MTFTHITPHWLKEKQTLLGIRNDVLASAIGVNYNTVCKWRKQMPDSAKPLLYYYFEWKEARLSLEELRKFLKP
jgi:hypothetical protein